MKTTILRLPEGLHEKVRDAAAEDDMTVAEWIREVLRDEFEEEEPEPDEDGKSEGDETDEPEGK